MDAQNPRESLKIKDLIDGIDELTDWLGEQTSDRGVQDTLAEIKRQTSKLNDARAPLPPDTPVREKTNGVIIDPVSALVRYTAKVIDPC